VSINRHAGLPNDKRQKSDVAGALKRVGQSPLVTGTGASTLTGLNFAKRVQKPLQKLNVFVINKVGLLGTKAADFL
jgi:hypothetical protein